LPATIQQQEAPKPCFKVAGSEQVQVQVRSKSQGDRGIGGWGIVEAIQQISVTLL